MKEHGGTVQGANDTAKSSTGSGHDGGMDDIRADLKALKDDIGSLVKKLFDENMDLLKNVKEQVVDKAGDAAGIAEDKIKSRPLLALLMAFLVGLLFGGLMRRR
jgi:ElaB/YqjD/DUF883 family membrane-anchored ribosome-binding protein